MKRVLSLCFGAGVLLSLPALVSGQVYNLDMSLSNWEIPSDQDHFVTSLTAGPGNSIVATFDGNGSNDVQWAMRTNIGQFASILSSPSTPQVLLSFDVTFNGGSGFTSGHASIFGVTTNFQNGGWHQIQNYYDSGSGSGTENWQSLIYQDPDMAHQPLTWNTWEGGSHSETTLSVVWDITSITKDVNIQQGDWNWLQFQVQQYQTPAGFSGEFEFSNMTLTAVPEPSTYAAFAGLGVLGFLIYRRRKVATADAPAAD